jgi:type IV secretion system protein VirB11
MAELDELSTLKDRAKKKLERDMGPQLLAALYDPRTVEIMLNADGKLWQERLGEPMCCIGTLRAAQAEAIIKTVAGFHSKEITRGRPLVEGELPLDGSRFAGQLPPIVPSPTFAIRKRAIAVFTLNDYVDTGALSSGHCAVLKEAIGAHQNILVTGGTGSGKTTLVNAIIRQMVEHAPHERIFIIEDTGEIQCSAENFVQYHTSLDVSMTILLRASLRMRPDRILVGEVRGPEALDLLDAWNTGHEGGAATLHANNPYAGLLRLKSLITRNEAAPTEIEVLIGEVVHWVVHIARTADGRAVKEILKVSGYQHGQYITSSL